MNERNKELLSEVIEDRLERALNSPGDSEEDKYAFNEAMTAIGKQIELDKIEASRQEQIRKLNADEINRVRDDEFKKSEARTDRFIQIGIFAAGLVIAPLIEVATKKSYAKLLCEFEKDYTFTTSAGRALSGLFRFKK